MEVKPPGFKLEPVRDAGKVGHDLKLLCHTIGSQNGFSYSASPGRKRFSRKNDQVTETFVQLEREAKFKYKWLAEKHSARVKTSFGVAILS